MAMTTAARDDSQLAIVTLPDEIDITNVGLVVNALARALDDGTVVLVVDAAATTFCGSAGAAALMLANRQAAAAGSQLRLAASPAVLRILELTGADGLLDTYSTLAGAMAGRSAVVSSAVVSSAADDAL
jgi:anti-anti-sigma factor